MAEQLQAIAETLSASRSPMVVVDAIDLAAAAAAIDLARATSAVLVHAEPDDIAVTQEQGLFLTTLSEAAKRADSIIALGNMDDSDDINRAIKTLRTGDKPRTAFHLDTGPNSPAGLSNTARQAVTDCSLIDILGALKATAAGHPINTASQAASLAEKVRAHMDDATYGVFVFQVGHLSRCSLFAAMALADELSKTTRWTLLPIGCPPGQAELTRMALSLTGRPPPLTFRSCHVHHDHTTLQPDALIADGDVDTIIWISASQRPRPHWLSTVKSVIAIDAHPEGSPAPNTIHHLPIGISGRDYPAILAPTDLGGFIALHPSDSAQQKPTPLSRTLSNLTAAVICAFEPHTAARESLGRSGASA